MRQKVCHLAVIHPINDTRIFSKECVSLAKDGKDITFLAFDATSYEKDIQGVHCIALCYPVKNKIEVLRFRTALIFEKAVQINADIYHFHEPELLYVGLKLKKLGKKVIFDSHEYYGWQLRDGVHRPKIFKVPKWAMVLFSKFYMIFEAYVCRRIDAVVQVCKVDGKDYFQNRCRKSVFIRNLPEMLNASSISLIVSSEMSPSNTSSQSEQASNDHFAMVCIGTLTEERGITFLVKAACKADIPLILVGKFYPNSYEQFLRQMPEYRIVQFRGYQNREGMQQAMRDAMVGVATLLPVGQYHKLETLPTKVYDYMSMKLPVVLSDTPFARTINNQYHFGILVNPENVEEMADAITYLRNHPSEAKEMGENGYRAIITSLNWEEEFKKLIVLYDSL